MTEPAPPTSSASSASAAALAIACIEIGSVAIGYACLAAMAESAGAEILEASIVGGARFMILLRGPGPTLAQVARSAQKMAIAKSDGNPASWECYVAATEPPGYLDALYSLAPQSLGQDLVVCEAGSMPALLVAAEALLAEGATRALEIKPLRGARGGAIGFFTGASGACGLAAEGARARMRAEAESGRIEVIERPSREFREYFCLDGRG
jgi:microcompartment protein CcmL/EutN